MGLSAIFSRPLLSFQIWAPCPETPFVNAWFLMLGRTISIVQHPYWMLPRSLIAQCSSSQQLCVVFLLNLEGRLWVLSFNGKTLEFSWLRLPVMGLCRLVSVLKHPPPGDWSWDLQDTDVCLGTVSLRRSVTPRVLFRGYLYKVVSCR